MRGLTSETVCGSVSDRKMRMFVGEAALRTHAAKVSVSAERSVRSLSLSQAGRVSPPLSPARLLLQTARLYLLQPSQLNDLLIIHEWLI